MAVTTKELRRIFDAAVEIDDSAGRADFVQSACGADNELRASVESLLEAHQSAGRFCNPAQTPRPGAGVFSELTGSERIGRYKLLQKLGEGGCGVVYLAEQSEPVKRRVALKIIKLGMDTRSVVARFEAERQALAMMDHPNIARVLDGGATDVGRPFFVMELVRGIKITDYCDQNHLSVPARLELFSQVCQAVQHAHQKGVIHRDLKPSNVLIASDEGAPVAKVIDFGVAKATGDQRLTDKTIFTRVEFIIGTPAYMSPEQADGTSDVDTRSDIYALGVLLYELLTGRTPFDAEALQQSGLEAVRRALRETEPLRPSLRLRSLPPGELEKIAQRRETEPAKLLALVSGDLDWIVFKAMEKDRTRRYETANGLALDVQRHLADQPIIARPPSALYTFGKMVRRNRTAVSASIAVLTMLVLGVVASTWQAVRATRAEHEQRHLRVVADAANQEATLRAEESRQQLVRLHLTTGNKLVEEGDYFGALLRFVEALRLDAGRPEREETHRQRIAAVRRASPQLAHLWFHEGFMNSAEFSSDGTRVVGAGLDQTARVWDTRTGEPVGGPLRHDGPLNFAGFSGDGRRVVTGDEQGRLRFWDTQSGRPVGPTSVTTATDVDGVAFGPDGQWLVAPVPGGLQRFRLESGEALGAMIATTENLDRAYCSPDGTRVAAFGRQSRTGGIWPLESSNSDVVRLVHSAIVRFASFHPSGRQVATIEGSRGLCAWDADSGEFAWPPFKPGGDLYDCRYSADGRWLATASWSGAARIVDAKTGRLVGEPMLHRAGVAKAVFSPDSRWLATASWDNTARLWNPLTGQPASPSLPHAGFVLATRFSPDGTRLVTAGQDQTIRLWKLLTNRPARLVLRHGGVSKRLHYSPDRRRLVTSGDYAAAMVWDATTGKLLMQLKHSPAVADAIFSPDGRWILTAGSDGAARLWDADSGGDPRVVVRHTGELLSIRFSPDSSSFVTASADGTARIWRTSDGEGIGPPLHHGAFVKFAEFSPDGRRVLTASYDHTVRVWDARTGEPIGPPMVHVCEVHYAVFSPDGQRVATAEWDRTLLPRAGRVWDLSTGQRIGLPLQHQDGLYHIEFSPDGRLVATSSEDNTAAVWDAATGRRLAGPFRHADTAVCIRFSPDSRLVVTASSDGTARVWEVATGEAITPPLRHGGPLQFVDWSADGREVLTASDDGTACVWDLAPTTASLEELRDEAEVLSAHRLDEKIGAVLLTTAELRARWEASHRRKSN